MGARFPREKKRHLLLSIMYRVHRLLPLTNKAKLGLYLDLSWIFQRLAGETSVLEYQPELHPIRDIPFLFDNLRPTDRVLDVGCSSGTISYMVSRHVTEVVGVDHDAAAISEAKRRFPTMQFRQGDAIAFADNAPSFNVILLSHLLEHLDDPLHMLNRAAALADRIYIEVPDFEASTLNIVRSDLKRDLIYTDNDHLAEFDRAEMKALVAAAGLAITAEEYRSGVMRFWCEARPQMLPT